MKVLLVPLLISFLCLCQAMPHDKDKSDDHKESKSDDKKDGGSDGSATLPPNAGSVS